jgi:FSR family fosmidomycin resistance protein-like MFS transporter
LYYRALAFAYPPHILLTSQEITALPGWLKGISAPHCRHHTFFPCCAQEMLPSNAAMASGMMLGLSFGLGGGGAAITGAVADVIGLQEALLWSIAPLMLAIGITTVIPEKKAPTLSLGQSG